jgi:hypothetical protein
MADCLEHSQTMGRSDEDAEGQLIVIEQHLSNACRAAHKTVQVRFVFGFARERYTDV